MSTPSFAELLALSTEEVKALPPLPVGEYLLRILSHEERVAQKTQNRGVQFNFEVIGMDENVDRSQVEGVPGRKIRDTFWITQDALPRLAEFFRKLGLSSGSLAENIIKSPGYEIFATITQNPASDGSGTIYNNITAYRAK